MNTSLPGSRSSWPANQACLRARTSDLPCSLACAVFFECHTVTLEKAPHRALRYPKVTAVLKMSSDLRKGHVRGLIDQRKDLLTVGFNAMRALVAPLRSRLVASCFAPVINPLDRRRNRNTKPLSCSSTRQPAFNRINQPYPKILGKSSCHEGWPPLPALNLNQIKTDLGILNDSVRSESALERVAPKFNRAATGRTSVPEPWCPIDCRCIPARARSRGFHRAAVPRPGL